MVTSKEKTTISVSIDKDIKKLLEKYSEEIDLTLSKFARNLIYVALDDVKLLRKTRFTKLVVPFRNLLDTLPGYKENLDAKIAKANESHITISVIIDVEVREIIEEIAKEIGLPVKTFSRNLIYVGLDSFKLLKKIGVIRVAVSFRDFLESFKNFEPKKETQLTTP